MRPKFPRSCNSNIADVVTISFRSACPIFSSHLRHDEDIGKQDGSVQVVPADGLHRHLRNIVRVLNGVGDGNGNGDGNGICNGNLGLGNGNVKSNGNTATATQV